MEARGTSLVNLGRRNVAARMRVQHDKKKSPLAEALG